MDDLEVIYTPDGEVFVVGVVELEDISFPSIMAANFEYARVLSWRRERTALAASIGSGRRLPGWLQDQIDSWCNAGTKPSFLVHWPVVWPSSLALTLSAGPVQQYWVYDPTECTWSVEKETLS
jgi:hypothetical protein